MNILSSKALIQFDGEFKSFKNKHKLKECSTKKPALKQMLKDKISLGRKGHNQKQENYEIGKLTSNGKHTVKAGNQPHTNLQEGQKKNVIKSFVSTVSS